MSNTQRVNLDDIRFLFLDSERPREAIEILLKFGSAPDIRYLNDMLRSHREYPVTNAAEIRKRASFDALINGYAMLEIASLAQYIPKELPSDFRTQALAHLTHPSVFRYYEKKYPVFLAHLLRRRLNNELAIHGAADTGQCSALFAEFVGLTAAYQDEKYVRRFEWFLDDGFCGGYGLSDLIDLLSKPDQLTQVLLRPDDEQVPLHEATQGFYRFLQFCQRLKTILDRAENAPLLRAGMWFYYSYWFDIIGGYVANYIKDAVSRFRTWPYSGPDLIELHEFAQIASSTIEFLVNKAIGEPLRQAERLGDSGLSVHPHRQ